MITTDEDRSICPSCGVLLTKHSFGSDGKYEIEELCPQCGYKKSFAHVKAIGETTIVDFKNEEKR